MICDVPIIPLAAMCQCVQEQLYIPYTPTIKHLSLRQNVSIVVIQVLYKPIRNIV